MSQTIDERIVAMHFDNSDFEKIRPELVKKNLIRETVLNDCRISLFPVNAAVDEATVFLEKNVVYDLYR